MNNDVFEGMPEIFVIELDDEYLTASLDIVKNTNYPTIDLEALMDNLLDIIATDEAYSSSSRQDDINYLLQETVFVEETDSIHLNDLRTSVDIVINSVLRSLRNKGAFINGLQPYSFSRFLDSKTIILHRTKVFNFRDEKHPAMDTTAGRDFVF